MARHLGVYVERRPGRRDCEDVEMADEDVAALLMSMPLDNRSLAAHERYEFETVSCIEIAKVRCRVQSSSSSTRHAIMQL